MDTREQSVRAALKAALSVWSYVARRVAARNIDRTTKRRFKSGSALPRWAGAFLSSLLLCASSVAQTPPPEPSQSSTVGATVTNPVTGLATTVSELIVDPDGTPTAGESAFVRTADGYVFLVKGVGETFYNAEVTDDNGDPLAFLVISANATANTVELRAIHPDWSDGQTYTLATRLSDAQYEDEFSGGSVDPPVIIPNVDVVGSVGVTRVWYGSPGDNGRDGALVVPPESGDDGDAGPTVTYPLPGDPGTITATNRIGIEIGSIGGRGGNGGDSYASVWGGRGGGDGGRGGTVNVANSTDIFVTTTANPGNPQQDKDKHGIFAYSRSGAAGNGGSGYGAPGGGTGGHSSDGGQVTVVNNADATIVTTGPGGIGIFGSSLSGNGGTGGGQWGIVGEAGDGGYGGSGGNITITNNGVIQTGGAVDEAQLGDGPGYLSHGILAQSIGGSGGSSGASGNLIASLPSSGDNGGHGGIVGVTNTGTITTTAAESRGIFAQSIGGGGGSGGSTGGLVAIGGAGSNGGNAGRVTVINSASGAIRTYGEQSDGVFAQSVGGSGGGGSSSGGLVAVGGSGSRAGNGDAVRVENHGAIATVRERSRGIVAQSIGGGGGDGGSSGGLSSVGGSGAGAGTGSTVTIANTGSIETQGDASSGIFAQSIGGGGGNGGNSGGMVSVGGTGGSGGSSSTVTIEHSGSILTEGDESSGIFAQSVGGGGGNGGSAGAVGAFVGVAVGGSAAQGGAGGRVDLTLQGQDANTASIIRTEGDRSTGIFAQSVGGGGGNGGGAIAASAGISGSASVAVGGSGGAGGNGDTVTLSPGAGVSVIQTGGDDSMGVFLQSVGGGGGNGGYAISVAASASPVGGASLAVGVGGSGATGGAGGDVEVGTFDGDGNLVTAGFNGSIVTVGERSTGFVAQSVGGGGGNGGIAVAVAADVSVGFSGAIGVGVGGAGGGGGDGGTVSVGMGGNITTQAAHSTGMLVQSVGGGGGNGGGTIAASLAASGGGAATVSVGVGGSAGAGSDGGEVTAATASGNVSTSGESSSGIVVQSVGGGGGNGGYSVTAGVAGAGVGAGSVAVGLGGQGGGGGGGGTVNADLNSNVTTDGESSTGILVQSVGGGGGNGGFNVSAVAAGSGTGTGAVAVGLGGSGGTAGAGGNVEASSSGTITTEQAQSSALVVQSIGGGGGNGGFNVSGAISGGGVGSGAVTVGLGGAGASGGVAGTVSASSSGDIETRGDMSTGILAQSVGGGGGNGAFNVDVAISGAGVGSGAVGVGLGGTGGAGADGSTVDLIVDNDVTTRGNDSAAVIAQSIGGGGGNGGFNVTVAGSGAGTGSGAVGVGLGGNGAGGGDGLGVTNTMTGNIVTEGNNSSGLLVQSVGGGGGNGGFNVAASINVAGTGGAGLSVGIGGSGGTGGSSGNVTSTLTGNVSTRGDDASGVIAQSLGGGGGNGGFNVSGAISAAGSGGAGVSVGLGGSGGDGGTSGAVISTITGDVATQGRQATGVLAQSLGGGGGNGGINVSGAISASGGVGGAASVGIGGSGGGGGDSSTVDATVTGDVSTIGEGAAGIIAQSLGGGGGNGGLNVSAGLSLSSQQGGTANVGLGGSGGDGGDAQRATLTVTGDVTTQGENDAAGVLAQSLGGGGGNGGINVSAGISLSGGAGGTVGVGIGGSGGDGGIGREATATVNGDVSTLGATSNAITAQSIGGGGGAGGLNVTGGIAASQAGAGNVGVGIGGAGGGGGAAGTATATVTGNATTAGNDSHAVLVQSVGGGGGSGGLNVTGGLTASAAGAGSLAVGVGGFGGDGGTGGLVNGTVTGGAHTVGDQSYGVLMQSVGGGGGSGGLNVSGGVSLAKGSSGTASIGVGGFGGLGGTSSTVTGVVDGAVSTTGSKSIGVLAQSIGGGGGNGGLNVSGAVQLTTGGTAAAAIGLGGFGGEGGESGEVTLTRTGETVTTGARSDAVVAQSIGGGGGNGGINISGAISGTNSGSAFSATIGLGGFGGSGGQANAVDATVTGDVRATGLESDRFELQDGVMRRIREGGSNGILAQSVGGGGGNGGLNVSGGIAITASGSAGTSNALNIGIGGFGGSGGNAGAVVLDVDAQTVSAVGDQKFAIGAQSIGGGGGNGGINVSGGVVMDGQLTLGIGGFGGTGGTASNVDAAANTNIFASGANAIGFLAQSVGGGGGNGGINVSGGVQGSTTSSKPSLIFGLGGGGGAGNISGDVTATQLGSISVEGADSIGVLAQSVAGGGGNGGLNVSGSVAAGRGYSGALGVGGFAGDGADAGAVTLTSDGAIFVDGREQIDPDSLTPEEDRAALNYRERANGILAQSIGGGGGNGGMNVTGALTNQGSPIAIGVGGYGGGGGHAGAVTVRRGLNESSVIATQGADANALTAQSIGGGGGNAGANLVVEFSKGQGAASTNKQVLITVGGDGGDPGHGDAVDVTHIGEIITEGRRSDGILAQSIGGGGGNANVNLGGGFGRSRSDFNLAIGGGAGDGGEGRTVTVDHTGAITTLGEDATAIFAQSIGGGGGDAEADDSAFADYLTAPEILLNAFSEEKNSVDITLGRRGGTGGAGGAVNVTSNGVLTTLGDRSVGIRAQSIGNGGGVSGSTSVAYSGTNNLDLQVGLEGGEGGTAGTVSVTASGSVFTAGTDAHAIHAQSVGGGGGVGGAVTSTLMPSGNTLAIDLGGTGGTGGAAGAVDVSNSATLVTRGDGAHAVHAQSIGGGGGDGGFAGISETDAAEAATEAIVGQLSSQSGEASTSSTTISALVGGTGGTGATGSTVAVDNEGIILTEGRKAHGISAQSIGGGGGNGGMVLSGVIAGGGSSKSLSLDVGGFGGDGASSDDVTVVNEGTIYTRGDESFGIRATSIGGGGGDAGLLAELNIAAMASGSSATSINVNVGGEGGVGAAAGDISVTNRRDGSSAGGDILTEGAGAHAIFAQSLGGGGGNGSSIISANFAAGQSTTQIGVNIGGAGGTGGTSGDVSVVNEAQIETAGDNAHGVFAQSIGGGGGNGGLVLATNATFAATLAPLITLGGAGGDGNDAGDVTVDNSGSIVTRGANAHGIFAQSIGGGGGNAGLGLGLSDPISTPIAGVMSVLFGGRGGDGGQGGEVTVRHSGDITVLGANARAVVAESINGGGGHVALDFNGITSLPGGADLPFTGSEVDPVFLFNGGGDQTNNSNAGRVTLDYTGTFGAAGANGAANTVQAIGGGGGTLDLNLEIADTSGSSDARMSVNGRLGGANGSNNDGGEIQSSHAGDLATAGDNTLGLFVQSIGGGGGRANVAVSSEAQSLREASLSLGGENGSDENGGEIAHTQSGSIATSGAAAHGALLQSVGGGGGALTVLLPQSEVPPTSNAKDALSLRQVKTIAASVAVSAPIEVALGANGGSELGGGEIGFALSGHIGTEGQGAIGLILQSIGAGGGAANIQGGELTVAIGATAGASGEGGNITVTNTGDVSTSGARAHGIVLQSIGGGGGALFTDDAMPDVILNTQNAGNGGAIDFTQVGDIATEGSDAYGLLVQSIGGGGGFVDGAFAGTAGGAGEGGAIALTIDGNIVTSGEQSTALFAQSAGGGGGGDISVNLSAGHRILAGEGGTAVVIDGGAHNSFENFGSVMTMSGLAGLALRGGAGDDAIVNHNIVVGNIDLGEGGNSFANRATARLYSSETLNLGGPSGLFTNDGLLIPGGDGVAVSTQLDGSFLASPSSRADFELDFETGVIDSIIASGAVELDGAVDISLLNVHRIPSGRHRQVLFSGADGLIDNGLALSAQPSIVIDYELLFADGKTAALIYDVDFSPQGLFSNSAAIGDYFNRVQAVGSSEALADTITRFVSQTDLDTYSDLLTQLSPEFYAEQQVYMLAGMQQFSRTMQDCGSLNLGAVTGNQAGCVWARFDIDAYSRGEKSHMPGSEETARRYSYGVQRTRGESTYGIGIQLDKNDSHGYTRRWHGETTGLQMGVLGRRAFGATSAGATLTLGYNDQNVTRRVSVTQEVQSKGDRNSTSVSGVFDLTHYLNLNGIAIAPSLNLGISTMHIGSLAEANAGAQNLMLRSRTETHTWIEPAIAFGYQYNLANMKTVRGYARVGTLYYLSRAHSDTLAHLEGAPLGIEPMRVAADLGRTHFVAEGGFELIAADKFTVGLSYALEDSDVGDSNAGTIRIMFPLH